MNRESITNVKWSAITNPQATNSVKGQRQFTNHESRIVNEISQRMRLTTRDLMWAVGG